jgi:hypothetical protein
MEPWKKNCAVEKKLDACLCTHLQAQKYKKCTRRGCIRKGGTEAKLFEDLVVSILKFVQGS